MESATTLLEGPLRPSNPRSSDEDPFLFHRHFPGCSNGRGYSCSSTRRCRRSLQTPPQASGLRMRSSAVTRSVHPASTILQVSRTVHVASPVPDAVYVICSPVALSISTLTLLHSGRGRRVIVDSKRDLRRIWGHQLLLKTLIYHVGDPRWLYMELSERVVRRRHPGFIISQTPRRHTRCEAPPSSYPRSSFMRRSRSSSPLSRWSTATERRRPSIPPMIRLSVSRTHL